jgi:CRISPR-associated protein Cmr1
MVGTTRRDAERIAIVRKQPSDPPPEVISKQPAGVITEVREYELITPLLGGGVTPKETDEVTVVRATEIRGHLRFWWRACHAGKFSDIKAMKRAEDTLWGTAYKKGDPEIRQDQIVQIVAETTRSNRLTPESARAIPTYVAGPLQDEMRKRATHMLRERVAFSLSISFPIDKQKEVRAALWAWETFGGIGARTRRGFGSLRLLRINGAGYAQLPPSHQVRTWIERNINNFVEPGTPPAGLPYLSKNTQFVVLSRTEKAEQAWKRLIDRLRTFRQAGRPGPSEWPEAQAIRGIIGERGSKLSAQKFPRAAFGLPIIFHFKGDDPKDTTLIEAGEEANRFASPLILRVFQCSDNYVVGLALLLEGSRVDAEHLTLEEQDGTRHEVQGTLTRDEASKISVLNGETDVLRAFMNSLKGGR